MNNTQSSFSLNPNAGVSSGSGMSGANEGYFWESQLWPFGNMDQHSAGVDGSGLVAATEGSTDKERKETSNGEGKLKRKCEADLETHIYTERERRKKMRSMFSNLHAMLPQLPPKGWWTTTPVYLTSSGNNRPVGVESSSPAGMLYSTLTEFETDKTTIVDEAVRHIKTLETQLQNLQEHKANKVRCATNATITYEPLPSTAPHLKAAGQTTRESFLAEHAYAASQRPPLVMNIAPGPHHDRPLVMFHTWTSPNVVLNTFGQEAQIMICSPRKVGLLTSVVIALEKHMIEVESATVSCDGKGSFYMIHVRLASGAIEHCPDSFSMEGVFKQAVRELMLLFPSK